MSTVFLAEICRYSADETASTYHIRRACHTSRRPLLWSDRGRYRVADPHQRGKARPSFREAIVKWENADYLALIERRGGGVWAAGPGDRVGAAPPAYLKPTAKGDCMRSLGAECCTFAAAALIVAGPMQDRTETLHDAGALS
jgi:hypothetical protein